MEIKNDDGKIKTLDELLEEAVERMVDELDSLSTENQIELGNDWRDNMNYTRLYENNEENINNELDGIDPYQVLQLGEDWSSYTDFFLFDGWDLTMTDDVWYDIDEDELARELLYEDFTPDYMPSEIQEVIDEYNEAKELIENYNPYRAMCEEVIARYVNCEADVTDLLQTLDKLARTDEAWKEE